MKAGEIAIYAYLMSIENRKTGEKVNGNLLYTIKPIDETLKTFHEKQMAEFERKNQISTVFRQRN